MGGPNRSERSGTESVGGKALTGKRRDHAYKFTRGPSQHAVQNLDQFIPQYRRRT